MLNVSHFDTRLLQLLHIVSVCEALLYFRSLELYMLFVKSVVMSLNKKTQQQTQYTNVNVDY